MLYGMTVARYQGVYLGFLQMFYSGNAGYSTGPRLYRDGSVDKEFHIDIQLAWSRDGIHWERHPGRPIEVVNAGVSGWSWLQGLRFFEVHGEALHPNVVVVAHGLDVGWQLRVILSLSVSAFA